MRHRIILATAASALAIASPAAAKDGAGYVGFDAGVLMPKDTHLDAGDQEVDFDIEHKTGFDIDIIGGYDFGFIRAEGELGWKRAVHDQYSDDEDDISADGETAVRSVMVNVLGDVGSDKWSFYAGGGVGYAWVRNRIEVDDEHETFKDSGFAWQGIAGIRYAVNEIIDIGVKYRYFDTSSLEDEDLDFDFTSHSLMFSFIYNMGGERRVAPPPPPPPYVAPPPPPAPPPTQTCPDGSVILATDACPPPPPPPPPPPEPERG